MSGNYKFIETDTEKIITDLIAMYEEITGYTVNPASPERLFMLWVANVFTLLSARINYTGNQNIPQPGRRRELRRFGGTVLQQGASGG